MSNSYVSTLEIGTNSSVLLTAFVMRESVHGWQGFHSFSHVDAMPGELVSSGVLQVIDFFGRKVLLTHEPNLSQPDRIMHLFQEHNVPRDTGVFQLQHRINQQVLISVWVVVV